MWWLLMIPIIVTAILGVSLHNWEDNEERRSINRMADRDRRRQRREPPRDMKRLRYATIGRSLILKPNRR